jgi:hypothetical protein
MTALDKVVKNAKYTIYRRRATKTAKSPWNARQCWVFPLGRPMAAHGSHSDWLFRIVSVKKHEKHLHTGQIPTNISRAIELRNYFSVR